MRRRVLGILCVSVLPSACILPKEEHAKVSLGTTLASKYVHRGQTLVDGPVFQPKLAVTANTVDGGSVRLQAFANMDLRNDTGAAWFPDGHAGRITEMEYVGAYSRSVGGIDLEGGLHSYNLPNGLEFVNGERGGTSEIFVTASTEVLEARPYASIHYDFDEVGGAYYRGGITESFDLGAGFELVLDGSLGYVSEAQAAWMYGLAESGFADLRGMAELTYLFDERTVLSFSLNGSTIEDSDLRRWFVNDIRIDADPIWVTLGVVWVL